MGVGSSDVAENDRDRSPTADEVADVLRPQALRAASPSQPSAVQVQPYGSLLQQRQPHPAPLQREDSFPSFSRQQGTNVPQTGVREAPKWTMPHGSSLPPATDSMRTLKGARIVDSAPCRKVLHKDASTSSLGGAEELSAPLRPTRAGIESENAQRCASLDAARALQDTLVKKVRSMREALARGDAADGAFQDCEDGFARPPQGLQSSRAQAVALEAELDRYRDKIRAHMSVSDRQRREMSILKLDSSIQGQRTSAARKECVEARERLQKGRQECAELHRKAKTEQLRVVMLRDAFEQEQTRVGVSLGRAESFVSDLVAATEGTRRVEVEEQSLARECASALSEIHAAEVQDELTVESEVRRLKRDLLAAEATVARSAELEGNAASSHLALSTGSSWTYANLQSECQMAASQLADARRRCDGASAIALQCLANEANLRRSVEALKEGLNTFAKELKEARKEERLQEVSPRTELEEAAEVTFRQAEAKIAGLVALAQRSQSERRRHSPGVDSARECATKFSHELDFVKAQLSEQHDSSLPRGPSGLQDPDWRLDLEAAGLQRRLGKVLSLEREMYCQLLEAQQQLNLRHPPTTLQNQVQVTKINGLLRQ